MRIYDSDNRLVSQTPSSSKQAIRARERRAAAAAEKAQQRNAVLPDPVFLLEAEVAAMLGLHPKTLAKMRWRGEALIPFVRVGHRGIRYRSIDVRHYIKSIVAGRSQT
ncbi:helix-turn-helix protein [Paraburkholderia sp. RAU2J]|uniref:helix-turn-helix domain-containing protein n=1 Tax=Paraburkholderia sp. RAU2J TaxID=1938810 RepID=UPI000EB523B1|nr:helix-turn-helix domain-containing protein [Paraburkholderia sp. RAU2J]RKT24445.1 helix-turn-helix protein [Paraburkholderia sp. RAU2J]